MIFALGDLFVKYVFSNVDWVNKGMKMFFIVKMKTKILKSQGKSHQKKCHYLSGTSHNLKSQQNTSNIIGKKSLPVRKVSHEDVEEDAENNFGYFF